MSALGDLRKTSEKLDEFQGNDINHFLEAQNSRLTALGYIPDEHVDTPVEELDLDPEKYARWVLGQLLSVCRDELKGQPLIASMITWRIYATQILDFKIENNTGETK